jgi:hypothetical protein
MWYLVANPIGVIKVTESYLEFSAWNEPIASDVFIPEMDKWLFDEPIKTTASLVELQMWITDVMQDDNTRKVAGIISRIVIKARAITMSPWVRV